MAATNTIAVWMKNKERSENFGLKKEEGKEERWITNILYFGLTKAEC